MRPIGVESKNDIGARSKRHNMRVCKTLDAYKNNASINMLAFS